MVYNRSLFLFFVLFAFNFNCLTFRKINREKFICFLKKPSEVILNIWNCPYYGKPLCFVLTCISGYLIFKTGKLVFKKEKRASRGKINKENYKKSGNFSSAFSYSNQEEKDNKKSANRNQRGKD
jgi:hypothetical protein